MGELIIFYTRTNCPKTALETKRKKSERDMDKKERENNMDAATGV